MKRFICFIVSAILVIVSMSTCVFSSVKEIDERKVSYEWEITGKKYKNFTDLGNYVIDCNPHENFDFEKACAYTNAILEKAKPNGGGCTAIVTKTDRGDVIIGRNMDLEVSQAPCYITHVKNRKYETINFTYEVFLDKYLSYKECLDLGEIDEEHYNALPMFATDSMNEAGLYIESNMRDYEEKLICRGTNPSADIRVCSISVPFVLASNCATVDEAVKYLKESLNVYTIVKNEDQEEWWNMCFVMGDAIGNYGVVEIAKDEISFLPLQHGQANFYTTPAFNAISQNQCGYGRLQYGLENINKVQNEEDMEELMKHIMWKNAILNIPYAFQDERGHIHFYADEEKTIPSIDWRSDHIELIPVNEEGHYVDINDDTYEAQQLSIAKKSHDDYEKGIDIEKNKNGYDVYEEYLARCDTHWLHTDSNFKELQKGLIQYYTENGVMDKLKKYYNGDEEHLRNNGHIWTTSYNLTVNCTQKRLTIKFWEKPGMTMHYQW